MSRPSRTSPQQALRARDAGLRKVSVTTRVLIAGSVAATAFVSTLAAAAQHGHATSTGSAAVGRRARGRSAVASGDNLAPPATLPAPSYQYTSPVMVSAAS